MSESEVIEFLVLKINIPLKVCCDIAVHIAVRVFLQIKISNLHRAVISLFGGPHG